VLPIHQIPDGVENREIMRRPRRLLRRQTRQRDASRRQGGAAGEEEKEYAAEQRGLVSTEPNSFDAGVAPSAFAREFASPHFSGYASTNPFPP